VLGGLRGSGAQAGATGEQVVGAERAELVAQPFGRVDDECLELTDRPGPGLDRPVAGGEQDTDRFTVAAAAGLGQVLASERFSGSPGSIQLVALGPVASSWACWPVDLDDPLVVLQQERGKACAVAAGALDRPDPAPRSVLQDESVDAL
jgi:hypothetical protein